MRNAYVYIMTNKSRSTLYTGCTNDLIRRVTEHKNHKYKGSFTDRYNCHYCIYFEELDSYQSAINRENKIKNMSRAEKEALINAKNPDWKELVNEKGFIRDKTAWSDIVKSVMDEIWPDK